MLDGLSDRESRRGMFNLKDIGRCGRWSLTNGLIMKRFNGQLRLGYDTIAPFYQRGPEGILRVDYRTRGVTR